MMAEDDIDFSMNTGSVKSEVASWLRVAFSRTLLLFHSAILLTITAVWLAPMAFRLLRWEK